VSISKKSVSLISFLISSNVALASQEPAQHETVVVTANRTSTTVDDTISSVTVFNEQDIRKSGARSVAELLSGVAGATLTSNGGRGVQSSIFVRGTNSTHILVLIDGVKAGSATNGSVSYENLSLAQVERIEVVKGPRSSLYGSEAIGGIVQIFTKKGLKQTQVDFSVGGGSEDTVVSSASVRGAVQGLTYSAGISTESTSGANVNDNTSSWGYDADKDGYDTLSGNLNLGYRLNSSSELSAFVLQTESELEFDGYSQDSSEKSLRTYGLGGSTTISEVWMVDVNAGRYNEFTDSYKNDVYASTFDSTRDSVQLVNDLSLSENVAVLIGGDFQKEKVKVIDPYAAYSVTERENIGGFAQLMYNRDKHALELSGRYDDNEQFGNANTGSIGYGYQVSDNLRFVSSFGTAFRAPSFNELYYVGYGTPTLRPEKSRTTELGVRWSEESLTWSFAAYNTVVKDLIGTDTRPDTTPGAPAGSLEYFASNIGKAKIRGFDLSVRKQINAQYSSALEFGYVDAKDASGGSNDGNRLQRRPEDQVRLNLTYENTAWTHGVDFVFASSAYNNLANTQVLDAYRIVNIRSAYAINDSWSVSAKVDNVFDSKYETVRDYNERRRFVLVSLNYSN